MTGAAEGTDPKPEENDMKTKITINGHDVTLERDDLITGERTTTTYFVPHLSGGAAGYVRIRDAAGRCPQVCRGLSGTGATLMATADTLPAVIRRELRRLVTIERRITQ